jgi:hypothetical protein
MSDFPKRWHGVVDKASIKRIIRREVLRYHALKKAAELYPDLKEYFEEVDKQARSSGQG